MIERLNVTKITRHGHRVVISLVSPPPKAYAHRGTRYFDLEYLDSDGAVVKYREALPEPTVDAIGRLERWRDQ